MKKFLVLSISQVLSLLLLSPGRLPAQGFFEFPPASPFNRQVIKTPDSAWSYTFLAGGHLYGSHENERSLFPSASLLGNIKRINANPVVFMVSLGDLMRSAKDPAMIEATRSAFQAINHPVFNAPGNHDLDDRAAYEKAFGISGPNTFFQLPGAANQVGFFIRDDYYMIMDSEYLLQGQSDKLMSFIDREVERLQKRPVKARNIFVFSHRLLWALCNDELAPADELANEPLRGKVNADTVCMVVDDIAGVPHSGEIYWLSGDVGTHWSVPLLYGYDPGRKIHTVATGIGDGARDALLKVTVNPEGKVSLGTLSLTEAKWEPVQNYTLDYWEKQKNADRNANNGNGFFAKIRAAMGGEVFWGALGMGLALGLLLGRLLFRRRK